MNLIFNKERKITMNKEMYIEMLEEKVNELKEFEKDNEYLMDQIEQRDKIVEKYISLVNHLKAQEKHYWNMVELAEDKDNEDAFCFYRTIWDVYYVILRDFDLEKES